MKLKDKVAIVTGATSGMGIGIAEEFAREGAAVILSGRSVERGQAVLKKIRAAGGRAEFVASDVSKAADNQLLVKKAVEHFGGLDILVPNAGTLGMGKITEITIESWHDTISTNLDSVFYLCHYGIPEMQKRGKGAIVVNGSIAMLRAFFKHPAYCASKGALGPLVRQLALDYGPEIRVNLMMPAQVDTPLLRTSVAHLANPQARIDELASHMPLRRLGTPQDIAKLALFLASDDSSWITGAFMLIDGGHMTMCT